MNEPSPGTAPKVLPTDIEASIAGEHYFTAAEGVDGADLSRLRAADPYREKTFMPLSKDVDPATTELAPLTLLTICVLQLKNGFTVVGTSACASPENFDAAYGRKLARGKAVEQIWPLLGYELRTKLHQAPKVADAVALLDAWANNAASNAQIFRNEGRGEESANAARHSDSFRAAIAALGP